MSLENLWANENVRYERYRHRREEIFPLIESIILTGRREIINAADDDGGLYFSL